MSLTFSAAAFQILVSAGVGFLLLGQARAKPWGAPWQVARWIVCGLSFAYAILLAIQTIRVSVS